MKRREKGEMGREKKEEDVNREEMRGIGQERK